MLLRGSAHHATSQFQPHPFGSWSHLLPTAVSLPETSPSPGPPPPAVVFSSALNFFLVSQSQALCLKGIRCFIETSKSLILEVLWGWSVHSIAESRCPRVTDIQTAPPPCP
jgi:hypothetical protein